MRGSWRNTKICTWMAKGITKECKTQMVELVNLVSPSRGRFWFGDYYLQNQSLLLGDTKLLQKKLWFASQFQNWCNNIILNENLRQAFFKKNQLIFFKKNQNLFFWKKCTLFKSNLWNQNAFVESVEISNCGEQKEIELNVKKKRKRTRKITLLLFFLKKNERKRKRKKKRKEKEKKKKKEKTKFNFFFFKKT